MEIDTRTHKGIHSSGSSYMYIAYVQQTLAHRHRDFLNIVSALKYVYTQIHYNFCFLSLSVSVVSSCVYKLLMYVKCIRISLHATVAKVKSIVSGQ